MTSCVVDSLAGEPTLKKVIVRHVETNEKRELPVEGIFVYIGHVSNARFVPENLERNEQGFILTDQEMQTNIPGILQPGIPGRNYAARFAQLLVTARLRQIPPFGIWSS